MPAKAMLRLAFDKFPYDTRVVAVTQRANDRSIRLLEALGMERTGLAISAHNR